MGGTELLNGGMIIITFCKDSAVQLKSTFKLKAKDAGLTVQLLPATHRLCNENINQKANEQIREKVLLRTVNK